MSRAFMHINGYSGSGKTTLGQKLKQKFKHQIIVKDMDDFLPSISTFHQSLQDHEIKELIDNKIQKFIDRNDEILIILIGTACNSPIESQYPLISAENLIWYNVSIDQATHRALDRQIDWLNNNRKRFIQMTKQMTIDQCNDYLISYYNSNQRVADWSPLFEICKNRGYIELNQDEIFHLISARLEHKSREIE
jgi:adenylate kinase family enzyme